MYSKVCRSAAVAVALSAGPAALAANTVEHVFTPSADNYRHWANLPHGDQPFLEMYEIVDPAIEGVGMMAFDLSGLVGVDPANLISAELQIFPRYSGQAGLIDGDAGLFNIMARDSAFDEIDPNPLPDSTGGILAEVPVSVGSLSAISLTSPTFLDEVRGWAVNPAMNYGLDLYLSSTDDVNASFYLAIHSSEAADPSLVPQLVVTEQVIPAPSAGLLVLVGALGSMTRRR
jgi:hypothetical protein